MTRRLPWGIGKWSGELNRLFTNLLPVRLEGNVFQLPISAKFATGADSSIKELWMGGLIKHLCGAKDSPTMIDIGANVGQTLLQFKAGYPNGKYRGFEPVAASVFFLQQLIRRNNLSDAQVIPLALGESTDLVEIFVTDGNPTGSGSTISTDIKCLAKKTAMLAPVFSLDDIFPKLAVESIDVMKIDVEGFEPDVLRGSEDLICQFRPPIIVEILPEDKEFPGRHIRRLEISQFLARNRYSLWEVSELAGGAFGGLREVNLTPHLSDKPISRGARDFVMLPS